MAIFPIDLAIASSNNIQSAGLIESFQSIISKNKKEYQNTIISLKKNTISLRNIKNLQSISLSKEFTKSLLLYTENKYLRFANNNECKLLSLIDTGLAKTATGNINFIPTIIKFIDGKKKTVLVTKKDYLDYSYSTKCLNNREMLTLFNSKNISSTIKSLNVSLPKTEEECSKVHNKWIQNPYLPYICAVSESIRKSTLAKINLTNNSNYSLEQIKKINQLYLKGKSFSSAISPLQKEYIHSLCYHLHEPKKFCAPYLAPDAWSKINQKELPLYKMIYKCKHIVKKENLDPEEIAFCAKKFNENPKICTTSRNKHFTALFPMPNCGIVSKSLLKSSLYTNYHDCPGNIDNHSIVNIHRIMAHKKRLSIPSDKLSCSSQANYSLAKLISNWSLKICYFDKISDKKECIPYIPNHSKKNDPMSEEHIVARILYRIAGTPDQKPCNIVSDSTFNPLLLNYKHGCFIVYNSKLCTTLHCEKKIIYDLKEIKGIEYTGINTFDYFANSFKNEKFSINKALEESLKTKGKPIHNLTFLKNFFKKHPRAITHGIGCAEDLLPSFFQKNSLSKCSPLPFIVDGIIEKKGMTQLSFRSAIDDVHSPRIIAWDQIFNSISNYKELHPLSKWTFHGIK